MSENSLYLNFSAVRPFFNAEFQVGEPFFWANRTMKEAAESAPLTDKDFSKFDLWKFYKKGSRRIIGKHKRLQAVLEGLTEHLQLGKELDGFNAKQKAVLFWETGIKGLTCGKFDCEKTDWPIVLTMLGEEFLTPRQKADILGWAASRGNKAAPDYLFTESLFGCVLQRFSVPTLFAWAQQQVEKNNHIAAVTAAVLCRAGVFVEEDRYRALDFYDKAWTMMERDPECFNPRGGAKMLNVAAEALSLFEEAGMSSDPTRRIWETRFQTAYEVYAKTGFLPAMTEVTQSRPSGNA